MLSISKILDRLRDDGRFESDDDTANALHVSAQTFSRWRRGKNEPDLVKIVNLAYEKGIRVEYLLYGGATMEADLDGFQHGAVALICDDPWLAKIIVKRYPWILEYIGENLDSEGAITPPRLRKIAENQDNAPTRK